MAPSAQTGYTEPQLYEIYHVWPGTTHIKQWNNTLYRKTWVLWR